VGAVWDVFSPADALLGLGRLDSVVLVLPEVSFGGLVVVVLLALADGPGLVTEMSAFVALDEDGLPAVIVTRRLVVGRLGPVTCLVSVLETSVGRVDIFV